MTNSLFILSTSFFFCILASIDAILNSSMDLFIKRLDIILFGLISIVIIGFFTSSSSLSLTLNFVRVFLSNCSPKSTNLLCFTIDGIFINNLEKSNNLTQAKAPVQI